MWSFELDCFIKAISMFLIYNVIAINLFGIPNSLSVTYYHLNDKKPWLRWFFPAMMWFVAFCMMPAWIEISSGSNFQFMSFLAAAGIMFVGAAPAFRSNKLEDTVHKVSAISAAIFSILWIILVTHYWWVLIIWFVILVIAAILTKTWKRAYVYWLEMVAFGATFTTVILHTIFG